MPNSASFCDCVYYVVYGYLMTGNIDFTINLGLLTCLSGTRSILFMKIIKRYLFKVLGEGVSVCIYLYSVVLLV